MNITKDEILNDMDYVRDVEIFVTDYLLKNEEDFEKLKDYVISEFLDEEDYDDIKEIYTMIQSDLLDLYLDHEEFEDLEMIINIDFYELERKINNQLEEEQKEYDELISDYYKSVF